MKKLLLIRHAQAEDTFLKTDIEREISAEGIREIEYNSSKFSKTSFNPERIIVSYAKRTFQTAENISKLLNWDKNLISPSDKLYNTEYKNLLNEIYSNSNLENNVVIVAHNPAITEVFNILSNSEFEYLPTCTFCFFVFNTDDWSKISYKNIKEIIKIDG